MWQHKSAISPRVLCISRRTLCTSLYNTRSRARALFLYSPPSICLALTSLLLIYTYTVSCAHHRGAVFILIELVRVYENRQCAGACRSLSPEYSSSALSSVETSLTHTAPRRGSRRLLFDHSHIILQRNDRLPYRNVSFAY